MKALTLIAALVASAIGLSWSEDKVLFPSGNTRYGAFGGPVVRYSPVNDEGGLLLGVRGGMILNSTFFVGMEGYGLATAVKADRPDTADLRIRVWGLVLEGIFLSDRVVHGSASLLFGAGGVGFGSGSWMGMGMGRSGNSYGMKSVLVLEPEVNLEVNVTPYFRVCPGISYRWFSGNLQAVESSWDLSGPSINMRFKFGRF